MINIIMSGWALNLKYCDAPIIPITELVKQYKGIIIKRLEISLSLSEVLLL